MSFQNISEELEHLKAVRENIGEPVPFGNPFLDKILGGIYPDDLIVMSARTGGGKTEFITHVTLKAATLGKRVHVFALEAFRSELGARIMFKLLSKRYVAENLKKNQFLEFPDFQLWMQGKQNHLFEKIEPEVEAEMKEIFSGVKFFYTDRDFGVQNFEAAMQQIGDRTDLVIIDHLHYFDLDSTDENKALKQTVKEIKNIVSFYRKPVLLVAHLRKSERYSEQLLPSIDDIHGSSDIAKIATHIIVTAAARDVELDADQKHLFPTYVRVLKNRRAGNRTFYAALCMFDSRANEYDGEYFLGEMKKNGTQFERIVDKWALPQWLR